MNNLTLKLARFLFIENEVPEISQDIQGDYPGYGMSEEKAIEKKISEIEADGFDFNAEEKKELTSILMELVEEYHEDLRCAIYG